MNGKLTKGIGTKREQRDKKKETPENTKILAVFVLGFLVLGVFAVLTYQNQQKNTMAIDDNFDDWQGVATRSMGTPHAPIHINGNDDFANQSATNGWTGDGTQKNPYVISGYDIDANGNSYCIWIENTSVYFIVCNSTLWNVSYNVAPAGGIALKNVENGTIENNRCTGNPYGIFLQSSSNNTIANNNITGSNYYGILVWLGGNNNVSNNMLLSNNVGIAIYSANNNSLWYNTCVSSTDEGIRLDNSDENVIAYNNCSESIRNSGLLMTSPSTNNTIMYNTFYKNKYYGINITDASSQNIIHHNSFFQNNGAGRGVNGNSQAYDSVGGNSWYDVSANEGNYWSNWDGSGGYPIAGGAGASDPYPLSNPVVPELSTLALIAMAIAMLGIVAMRKRR